MRIFVNKRLNVALDKAITTHIDNALERKSYYRCYTDKLYGFSWSEVL